MMRECSVRTLMYAPIVKRRVKQFADRRKEVTHRDGFQGKPFLTTPEPEKQAALLERPKQGRR
jgi:hypothetical protein